MALSKLHKTAYELQLAGNSIPVIAKKINKSKTTVNRYLKEYKDTIDPKPNTEVTVDRLDDMVDVAWETIKDCLTATKPYGKDAVPHPDFRVRLDAAAKILNAKGYLIEKKAVDANINFGDMSPDELTDFIGSIIKTA